MTQWRPKNPHKKDERRFGFPYICISIFLVSTSQSLAMTNHNPMSQNEKAKKDWFGGGWPI